MSARILVVEDDPKNIKLLEDLLSAKGYEVFVARHGQAGAALARSLTPDLVLMDIHMPVMDGFEALRCIRSDPATQGLCVWALTSYAMPADASRILEAGYDAYITKPFDVPDLLARIEQYCAGRQRP